MEEPSGLWKMVLGRAKRYNRKIFKISLSNFKFCKMINTNLFIPKKIWKELILELRKRGKGKRESGAFLIGTNNNITSFICYDDLDPYALNKGMITFHSEGFIPLFTYCEKNKTKVLADVHTHPGTWTNQSELDRTHPMFAVTGHLG